MAMGGAIVARPFGGEEDYARLRQMIIETIAIGDERHYGTIGDLDWWRYTDNDPCSIFAAQLWFAPDGAVVGCAWPNGDGVVLLTDPRGRAIEAAMLDWAEERHRASGACAPLSTYSFDGDTARVFLLRARLRASRPCVSLPTLCARRAAAGVAARGGLHGAKPRRRR